MHWLDRAALITVPPSRRIFSAGWGDPHAAIDDARVNPAPASIEVGWGAERDWVGGSVRDGQFASPDPGLPPRARAGRVRLVRPDRPTTRTCVLMPAWNDEGFSTRSRLARRLGRAGIASLMVEFPYYGSRRVHPRPQPPIQTVEEFVVAGRAAVQEAGGLLRHVAASGEAGVAGFSMGGNLAAFVSARAERPVATALLAASHSPGPVMTGGILRRAVDWHALATVDGPHQQLSDVLGRISVLALPPPGHGRHALMVAATNDGYVPASAVVALHDHWPGSELRWIPGGHASLHYRGGRALAGAIVDSFDRVAGQTPAGREFPHLS